MPRSRAQRGGARGSFLKRAPAQAGVARAAATSGRSGRSRPSPSPSTAAVLARRSAPQFPSPSPCPCFRIRNGPDWRLNTGAGACSHVPSLVPSLGNRLSLQNQAFRSVFPTFPRFCLAHDVRACARRFACARAYRESVFPWEHGNKVHKYMKWRGKCVPKGLKSWVQNWERWEQAKRARSMA